MSGSLWKGKQYSIHRWFIGECNTYLAIKRKFNLIHKMFLTVGFVKYEMALGESLTWHRLHLATVFISDYESHARSTRQERAWFLWCFIGFDTDFCARQINLLLLTSSHSNLPKETCSGFIQHTSSLHLWELLLHMCCDNFQSVVTDFMVPTVADLSSTARPSFLSPVLVVSPKHIEYNFFKQYPDAKLSKGSRRKYAVLHTVKGAHQSSLLIAIVMI